jgi:PKD repeat protein
VAFSSSGSYDLDGSIASYAWVFGDGATSTEANPSHTYTKAGAFAAKLTVTDNRGATAMRSLTITVRTATNYVVFVSDIKMEAMRRTTGPYAKATVTILNQSGRPAVSATVKGTFSNGTTTYSKLTDSYGRATLTSPTLAGGGTITFTVTDVVKTAYKYDTSKNVETSDSITLAASVPKAISPAAITDLSAKVVAPDKVELAWSASAASVKEYRLYRNGHLVAKTTSPGYVDAAAPKNVLTYRVRVVDEQGRLSPVSNAAKVDLRGKK